MRYAFEYAVLRVVPRIERGECLNAGVLLYCRALDHLGARVHLDPARLAALDPTADAAAIARALDAVVALCGDDTAGARYSGPAGEEDRGRRFRRLTAPRSTVVQPGPVHTGLTTDPAADLTHLLETLVHPPASRHLSVRESAPEAPRVGTSVRASREVRASESGDPRA